MVREGEGKTEKGLRGVSLGEAAGGRLAGAARRVRLRGLTVWISAAARFVAGTARHRPGGHRAAAGLRRGLGR